MSFEDGNRVCQECVGKDSCLGSKLSDDLLRKINAMLLTSSSLHLRCIDQEGGREGEREWEGGDKDLYREGSETLRFSCADAHICCGHYSIVNPGFCVS